MQGCQDLSQGWDKTMIEIQAPQKTLEIFFCLWLRHCINCINLGGKRNDSSSRDFVAKKVDTRPTENALLAIHGQARGPKAGEHAADVGGMLSFCGTRNQNIIQINKNSWQIAKNSIHKTLESLS